MDRVTIQEIADASGLSNDELIGKAKALGFSVQTGNSTLGMNDTGILVDYAIAGTLPKDFYILPITSNVKYNDNMTIDKVRIQEISDETGLSNDDLVAKAQELSFNVQSRNSTISMKDAGILVDYAISGTLPKKINTVFDLNDGSSKERVLESKIPSIKEMVQDNYHDTSLIEAISENKLEHIKMYLEYIDPEILYEDIDYAWEKIVISDLNILKLLIDQVTDIDVTLDILNGTALVQAVHDNDIDKVTLLINKGADFNKPYGAEDQTAFIDAVLEGKEEIENLFIQFGASKEMFYAWEKKHKNDKPKDLYEVLKKFSKSDKLRFSNHPWYTSKNYNKFIKDLKKGWGEIEEDLRILSSSSSDKSTLYEDLKSFLFSEDENVMGWSSLVIQKELKKGHNPSNIEGFPKAIKDFKSLFVIKQEDDKLKLLRRLLKIKKDLKNEPNFILDIDIDALKEPEIRKFFTDTKLLDQALKIILLEINDHAGENKNKVFIEVKEIEMNCKDMIELKIIHQNSEFKYDAKKLSETLTSNGGNFGTIYGLLEGICYWSVDTICKDGHGYTINYLQPKLDSSKTFCNIIGNQPKGFTHKLRFYI